MALRAGPVGLRCEAGLGPSRGWGSGRPAAPPPVPVLWVRRPGTRCPPSAPLSAVRRWCRCLRGAAWLRSRGGGAGGRVPGTSAVIRGGSRGGEAPRRAAATLDVRRALLADLHGYGSRWDPRPAAGLPPPLRPVRPSLTWRRRRRQAGGGGVSSGRGVHPARCLGRQLAAGLELVRTRGIRLFN